MKTLFSNTLRHAGWDGKPGQTRAGDGEEGRYKAEKTVQDGTDVFRHSGPMAECRRAGRRAIRLIQAVEDPSLHLYVGLDVLVRGLQAFVPEPQCDQHETAPTAATKRVMASGAAIKGIHLPNHDPPAIAAAIDEANRRGGDEVESEVWKEAPLNHPAVKLLDNPKPTQTTSKAAYSLRCLPTRAPAGCWRRTVVTLGERPRYD
jgi:hypothetical protein